MVEKSKPGRIGELKDIVAIEGNGASIAAISKDGTLWGWGRDRYNNPNLPSPNNDLISIKGKLSFTSGMIVSTTWKVIPMDIHSYYNSFDLAKLAPNVTAVAGNQYTTYFSFVLMKNGTVSYWMNPTEDT